MKSKYEEIVKGSDVFDTYTSMIINFPNITHAGQWKNQSVWKKIRDGFFIEIFAERQLGIMRIVEGAVNEQVIIERL
jgi:hypothetical protein